MGDVKETQRGSFLGEFIAERNMIVANQGDTPTWHRGASASCIDVTFTSPELARKIKNWKVHEDDENPSDHQNITFELEKEDTNESTTINKKKCKVTKAGLKKLSDTFQKLFGYDKLRYSPTQLNQLIQNSCAKSLASNGSRHNDKRPVYWFNADIKEKRKVCINAGRLISLVITRARKKKDVSLDTLTEFYNNSRKILRVAIQLSKEAKWKQLCDEAEEDVWGNGYKIVAKKCYRNKRNYPTDEEALEQATYDHENIAIVK